jgi:hypothetical protein
MFILLRVNSFWFLGFLLLTFMFMVVLIRRRSSCIFFTSATGNEQKE